MINLWGKKMFGQLSFDVDVKVPASEAWEVLGGLGLARLVEKQLPEYFERIELLQGDGGQGTVLKITFAQGTFTFSGYSEKFTKIDNNKRVKETEVIEGGYLELGFTLYRIRLEVEEKGEEECLIKSTIEYEVNEDASAKAAVASMETLAAVLQLTKTYLLNNKPTNA